MDDHDEEQRRLRAMVAASMRRFCESIEAELRKGADDCPTEGSRREYLRLCEGAGLRMLYGAIRPPAENGE